MNMAAIELPNTGLPAAELPMADLPMAKLPIAELRQRLGSVAADPGSAGAVRTAYRELLGFVPACLDRGDALAAETLLRGLHEQMRLRALIPAAIDSKTAHLMLLAMLLVQHGATAVAQASAARRAGASWDELRAVADMAFLLHGLPAANRGDELLAALAEREREDCLAGIVAAYG
jgi:4-carboxymuconolactone decarboxylase